MERPPTVRPAWTSYQPGLQHAGPKCILSSIHLVIGVGKGKLEKPTCCISFSSNHPSAWRDLQCPRNTPPTPSVPRWVWAPVGGHCHKEQVAQLTVWDLQPLPQGVFSPGGERGLQRGTLGHWGRTGLPGAAPSAPCHSDLASRVSDSSLWLRLLPSSSQNPQPLQTIPRLTVTRRPDGLSLLEVLVGGG